MADNLKVKLKVSSG